MKKLLSVVLMIAVVLTFSFSATMTASADVPKSVEEARAIVAAAYAQAQAAVEPVKVDFDSKYSPKQAHLPDPTVFVIDKATVQKGVDKTYEDAIKTTTLTQVTVGGTVYTFTANQEVDTAAIKALLLAKADTETYFKAAFPAYKTFLTGLVDKVKLEDYTTTVQDPKLMAKDGELYDTAAKAAAADVALAKKKISEKPEQKDEAGFKALYTEVFGDAAPAIVKPVENKDDVIYTTEISSVGYALTGDYPTKTSEAAAAATIGAAQAVAKAKLAQEVAKFQNSPDYKAKFADAVAAYVKAQTYIIENHKGANPTATINDLAAMSFVITPATTNADKVNGVDYAARVKQADEADKRAEFLKTDKSMAGNLIYDAAKIAENLVRAKYDLYRNGIDITDFILTNGALNYVQNTEKITLKDKADDIAGTEKENHVYKLDQPELTDLLGDFHGKEYYQKEWDALKAALEAYKAAIDAAKVSDDVTAAKDALKKAVSKLDDKVAVNGKINVGTIFGGDKPGEAVHAYYNAKRAAAGEDIYVAWEADKYDGGFVDANVVIWYIEKGARTADEAKALYSEACKVIDGYKTMAGLKAEAAKVVDMIKALPTAPALTDKAAVAAAKTAFDALPATVQAFVTNAKTLNDDIAALEKAEGYEVAKLVNALPSLSKVTPADKEAVDAAKKAVAAYKDSFKTTYKGIADPTYVAAKDGTVDTNILKPLTKAIRDTQLKAIKDAVEALNHKYQINGTLTDADAPAVKAAKELIEKFGKDYPANAADAKEYERTLANISGKVMELIKEGEIKAVEGIQLKVKSVRGKGYIKLTWRFVNGVKEDAQYYEVFKSTKRNSGFKKVFTTKDNAKLTYKNTKGLKKGVTYFFKVRAVRTIDGKKYTSDWSNKAYRTAK